MQPEIKEEHKLWISTILKDLPADIFHAGINRLDSIWEFLRSSERLLLQFHQNPSSDQSPLENGHTEFGIVLYVLNHLIFHADTERFLAMGLPGSLIYPDMWQSGTGSNLKNLPPDSPARVGKDGTLFLDTRYGMYDPGWTLSIICYLFRELGVIKNADFGAPKVLDPLFAEQETLDIAVIGDWGTGAWTDGNRPSPSQLVANAIKNLPQPADIVIHLGDVYYSGLKNEENENLVKDFPGGRSGYNFTLNSNHEVYNGSRGYFDDALTSPVFNRQQGASCFSFQFKNWIIICLDTAYFDESPMIMGGAIGNTNNSDQKKFLQSLNIKENQKIVLFTHHNGMDYSGTLINKILFDQIYEALGNHYPDYWYYGHIHNGIIYNEKSVMGLPVYKTRFNEYPRLRCVGHGAIPFGKADLDNNEGIDYFAKTALNNPDLYQRLRVLNGFAILSLSQSGIREAMYEVSEESGTRLAWQSEM